MTANIAIRIVYEADTGDDGDGYNDNESICRIPRSKEAADVWLNILDIGLDS